MESMVVLRCRLFVSVRVENRHIALGTCRALSGQFNVHRMVLYRGVKASDKHVVDIFSHLLLLDIARQRHLSESGNGSGISAVVMS